MPVPAVTLGYKVIRAEYALRAGDVAGASTLHDQVSKALIGRVPQNQALVDWTYKFGLSLNQAEGRVDVVVVLQDPRPPVSSLVVYKTA